MPQMQDMGLHRNMPFQDFPEGASVKLTAGKRSMTLAPKDLEYYRGERGRRGSKLPRGLQRIDDIEIDTSAVANHTEEANLEAIDAPQGLNLEGGQVNMLDLDTPEE